LKIIIASLFAVMTVLGSVSLAADEESAAAAKQETEGTRNPVVFWELASNNAEASVEFFGKVFDWEFEKIPDTIIYGVDSRTGERGITGGIFTLQKAKLPFLTIYVLVDDIEEKALLIEKSGGLVIEHPHEMSSGVWICLFNDPSGTTFAMLQRKSKEK